MRRQLNVRLLIVALIAGVIAAAADLALYYFLVDVMSARILIPVLVAVFAVILCGAITVYMLIFKESDDDIWFLNGRGMLCIALAICLLVTFFATMLMEWLYDSDIVVSRGDSSYIFVLDESDSMKTNDPMMERYKAVQTVVDTLGSRCPYSVYIFSDDCYQIRPMGPKSEGPVTRPGNVEMNLTFMGEALETIIHDIQGGQLNAGAAPHVILLTDGIANDLTDSGLNSVVQKLSANGIRVSTVGLSGNVDAQCLSRIASGTGGSYVSVANASDLGQGFANVANVNKGDNLLSPRISGGNALDVILRILFLVLIGALIGCMKGIACGDEFLLNLLITTGGALIGAVVMEVGLALGLPVLVAQAIYWLLMCVTIHNIKAKIGRISKGDEQMRNSLLTHGSGGASRSSVQW